MFVIPSNKSVYSIKINFLTNFKQNIQCMLWMLKKKRLIETVPLRTQNLFSSLQAEKLFMLLLCQKV